MKPGRRRYAARCRGMLALGGLVGEVCRDDEGRKRMGGYRGC